jgi:hypothetical protein
LNELGVIRFFNRLRNVVRIWVESPSKPEQKPEHGGGIEGNGGMTVWLGVPGFWDKSIRFSRGKHAQDRLAQGFDPIPSTSEPSTSSIGFGGSDTQSNRPRF